MIGRLPPSIITIPSSHLRVFPQTQIPTWKHFLSLYKWSSGVIHLLSSHTKVVIFPATSSFIPSSITSWFRRLKLEAGKNYELFLLSSRMRNFKEEGSILQKSRLSRWLISCPYGKVSDLSIDCQVLWACISELPSGERHKVVLTTHLSWSLANGNITSKGKLEKNDERWCLFSPKILHCAIHDFHKLVANVQAQSFSWHPWPAVEHLSN